MHVAEKGSSKWIRLLDEQRDRCVCVSTATVRSRLALSSSPLIRYVFSTQRCRKGKLVLGSGANQNREPCGKAVLRLLEGLRKLST